MLVQDIGNPCLKTQETRSWVRCSAMSKARLVITAVIIEGRTQIRVANAITGELLRELVLNPHIDYQPTGAPKGPTRRPRKRPLPDLQLQVRQFPMS